MTLMKVPDIEAPHVEGSTECVKYPLLMTAELLNQLMSLAYGHGATVTIKDRGPDGFCEVEVSENIDTSIVPTVEVLRSMAMEDLLRRVIMTDCMGGPKHAVNLHRIRTIAKAVIPAFDLAQYRSELLTGEWTTPYYSEPVPEPEPDLDMDDGTLDDNEED